MAVTVKHFINSRKILDKQKLKQQISVAIISKKSRFDKSHDWVFLSSGRKGAAKLVVNYNKNVRMEDG